MAERHRQGAIDGREYSVYTYDMSNIRYVNIIKVALFKVMLFKVTSDPFLKVASDLFSM